MEVIVQNLCNAKDLSTYIVKVDQVRNFKDRAQYPDLIDDA